jgi:acetoin utilization deacetylase AcuC-like enzyme
MKAGVFYHPDYSEKGYFVLKARVKPGFDALSDLIGRNRIRHYLPEIDNEIEALLAATHSPEHIASVRSDGEHHVALLSAAGVVQAAIKLAQGELDFAFCFVGAAGHHASYDSYWGFCFYNDAAMAVRKLRQLGVRRIIIIDVDPHFGDGTRNLLGLDPDIIHINFFGNSGVRKFDSLMQNYDIPIPGYGDQSFLEEMDLVFSLQDRDFEFLIVIFGHDSHANDYGNCRLSYEAFPAMAGRIRRLAGDKPVLFILSGGDNPDVARVVIPAVIEEFVG